MTTKSNKALAFTVGLITDFTKAIGTRVNNMDLQKLKCSKVMVKKILNADILVGKMENV